MKKYGELNNLKSKDNVHPAPEEELEFILWTAELNKELMAFWESIVLGEEQKKKSVTVKITKGKIRVF